MFIKWFIGYFVYMHNYVHVQIWYDKIVKLFWSVSVFATPKTLPIIGFDGLQENVEHSLYTLAEEKQFSV